MAQAPSAHTIAPTITARNVLHLIANTFALLDRILRNPA